MIKRTILIGDVHGCIDELNELLIKLSYTANDRIVLLGDLINRGPDSISVIKKIKELKLEAVKGNHELKFLKWVKTNDRFISQPFYKYFIKSDIEFIENLPSYIKQDNCIFVHAGLKPNIPLEQQSKNDLSYIRYINSKHEFVPIKQIMKRGKNNVYLWSDFWQGPESIIHGHRVVDYDQPSFQQKDGFFICGLDTGCVFGGKLTALILETLEIVQVQAKKTYYKPGSVL